MVFIIALLDSNYCSGPILLFNILKGNTLENILFYVRVKGEIIYITHGRDYKTFNSKNNFSYFNFPYLCVSKKIFTLDF